MLFTSQKSIETTTGKAYLRPKRDKATKSLGKRWKTYRSHQKSGVLGGNHPEAHLNAPTAKPKKNTTRKNTNTTIKKKQRKTAPKNHRKKKKKKKLKTKEESELRIPLKTWANGRSGQVVVVHARLKEWQGEHDDEHKHHHLRLETLFI